MYRRMWIWQEPIIASQSESGWINYITEGFPCVDIRLKLKGYGWKSSADTTNEVVLYEGRYKCYYREVGEETWVYFATVISERADQNSAYVYEDVFVEVGFVPERLYEIRIIAADGEKFQKWVDDGDGVLEGISENGEFWYDMKIRGVVPVLPSVIDSIGVIESVSIGVGLIELSVTDSVSTDDTLFYYIPVNLQSGAFDLVGVQEGVKLSTGWTINVNDAITTTEFLDVVNEFFLIDVFEDVLIAEAPFSYEPTRELSVYDDIPGINDAVFMDLPWDINIYDTSTIVENFVFQFDLYNMPLVYDSVLITENISTYMAIKFWTFDVISTIENINAAPDLLYVVGYDNSFVFDYLFLQSRISLPIVYDAITITENFSSISPMEINVYEDVTAQSISGWELLLHAENNTTDSASGYTPSSVSLSAYGTGVNAKWGTYAFGYAKSSTNSLEYSAGTNWNPYETTGKVTTIDFWVKHSGDFSTQQAYCGQRKSDGTEVWWISVTSSNNLRLYLNHGGLIFSTDGGALNDTSWHHIAVCNTGGHVGVYLDGVQVIDQTVASDYSINQPFFIGSIGPFLYLDGYLDEFRFTNANSFSASPNAGLTDTITVPTGPYTTQITEDITVQVV